MRVTPFELIYKVGEDYYSGGTIRALHERVELFFHLPWGSRVGAKIYETNSSIEYAGCSVDHISFHNNGITHSKGRDERKKAKYYGRLDSGISLFNLERGHFLPIYLHSVSLEHGARKGGKLKKIDATAEQREKAWDLTGLQYFSLVMVSKCATVHPGRLLTNHGFQNLTIVGTPHILADVFTVADKSDLPGGCISEFDTQLVVFVVGETWNEPPPDAPIKDALGLISCDILVPPMHLICQMQNLNQKC